jgi:hypothetical protein
MQLLALSSATLGILEEEEFRLVLICSHPNWSHFELFVNGVDFDWNDFGSLD